jgi:hypothetical protein
MKRDLGYKTFPRVDYGCNKVMGNGHCMKPILQWFPNCVMVVIYAHKVFITLVLVQSLKKKNKALENNTILVLVNWEK